MHGRPRLVAELVIRLIVLAVAVCMIYYGYHQFPARLRQLPPAVEHAHRLALRGDPDFRRR